MLAAAYGIARWYEMAEKRLIGEYPDYRNIPDGDTVLADHVQLDSGSSFDADGPVTYEGKLTMGTKPTLIRKLSSAPAVGDLSVGEMVMYESGSTRRLYFRII